MTSEILLVFGSRTWQDRAALWKAIGEIDPATIIEGEAEGADKMARQWAQFYRRGLRRFPADWQKHGRAAGPIRNAEMLRKGRATRVLGAITGPLGSPWSRGSADMARKALYHGLAPMILQAGGTIERKGAT